MATKTSCVTYDDITGIVSSDLGAGIVDAGGSFYLDGIFDGAQRSASGIYAQGVIQGDGIYQGNQYAPSGIIVNISEGVGALYSTGVFDGSVRNAEGVLVADLYSTVADHDAVVSAAQLAADYGGQSFPASIVILDDGNTYKKLSADGSFADVIGGAMEGNSVGGVFGSAWTGLRIERYIMFTLNSGNLTSDPFEFAGGTGVMVWDGASIGQTGTLILERKSKDAPASAWTPVGATAIGSGPAQLTIAGTRLFTETRCLLRLRVDTPSGDIICEVQRCHAGRLTDGA